MGRARGSSGTPSKASGRGKRKQREVEEEVQSKKKRMDSTNKVLKFDFCMNVKRFEDFMSLYDGKKVLKGRVFDFFSLGSYPGNLDLEVTEWLENQGWKDIFSYQAPTYPRLVQILMCNYNQTSRQSWIGKFKFDLSPAGLRNVLGLPKIEEDQEEIEWPTKDEIFKEIAKRELNRSYVYLPAKFLSLDQKLAHSVVFHMIYPKVGSSDQVPEKDARLIWALERKKKLDLAQLMSDHLDFMKINIGKVSLPYGMYWTKYFEKVGMDLSAEPADHFKNSDIINRTTIKRMGFRLVNGEWTIAKGPREEEVQAPVPPVQAQRRTQQAERRVEEEENEDEAERADERDSLLESVMRTVDSHLPPDEEATPSTAPARSTRSHPQPFPSPAPPTRPRTARQPPSTQFSSQQLKTLKAFITTSLTKLESSLTHRIDTLNQRVDNLDFKLDTIISLVESTQPPQRPDPYKDKMKGIAIQEPQSSSSDHLFHHTTPRPSQPIPPIIPPKPPTQPIPQPDTQPFPRPSPQTISKPASPQTQAALTLAAMPSTKPHPKPTPTTSSSVTISDTPIHTPSPQPSPKPSPQSSPKPSPKPSPQPSPKSSPKPSPKPSPPTSPIPAPAQPLLAITYGEEVGESGYITPEASPKLKPSVPIEVESSPSSPISSDSSDTPPPILAVEPIQLKPPSPPKPQPDRPLITITLEEFQRRSLENRKVMDMKIAAINENKPDTYTLPYPEIADPDSQKYIKVVSTYKPPGSSSTQPKIVFQGDYHKQSTPTSTPQPEKPVLVLTINEFQRRSAANQRTIDENVQAMRAGTQRLPLPYPEITDHTSLRIIQSFCRPSPFDPQLPEPQPTSHTQPQPDPLPKPHPQSPPPPKSSRIKRSVSKSYKPALSPIPSSAQPSATPKPTQPSAQSTPAKPVDASPYPKAFTRKKPSSQSKPKGA